MYAPFLHSVGSTGLLYAFLAFTEEYNLNNFYFSLNGKEKKNAYDTYSGTFRMR